MTTKESITAERLRELLTYHPYTGTFTWNVTRQGCGMGKNAGCIDKKYGYLVIKLDWKLYRGHRLAFLWMTGAWPINTIDHFDRDRSNNRWTNLREATRKQNQENLPIDPRNKSGHRGVHWVKGDNVWAASIGHKGRKYAIGRSPNIQEAIAMRLAAERHLFTHSEACVPLDGSLENCVRKDGIVFRPHGYSRTRRRTLKA